MVKSRFAQEMETGLSIVNKTVSTKLKDLKRTH